MTKIPPDDILEGLYKLRIRECEKLKTVLELCNIEIHQKKAGPDYHRLKTMMKSSIEQNLRKMNFEATNGNYETSAVVKNQGTKQREQKPLEIVGSGKANGQCSEGDNCSFRHDINKRAKSTQPNPPPSSSTRRNERNVPEARVPVEECLDCPARITSKELAPIHSVKNGIPRECLFYKSEKGCRFGEKCSYAHRQVEEQPIKRSEKNGDKIAVAILKISRQFGLRISRYGAAEVYNDFAEELKHTETNPVCKIQQSRCTSH